MQLPCMEERYLRYLSTELRYEDGREHFPLKVCHQEPEEVQPVVIKNTAKLRC